MIGKWVASPKRLRLHVRICALVPASCSPEFPNPVTVDTQKIAGSHCKGFKNPLYSNHRL